MLVDARDSICYIFFIHFQEKHFIIFFIGVYFFYLIGKFRYNDWRIGFLGSLLLVLSPANYNLFIRTLLLEQQTKLYMKNYMK